MKRLAQTLVVDTAARRILLAYHTMGDYAGSYTGFLGEVRDDESAAATSMRIAREQSGIDLVGPQLRAIFRFSSADWETVDEYEYYVESYAGSPRESAEVRPEWFGIDDIPFTQMPADDALWYPGFLNGVRQRGSFRFASGENALLHHELYEVEEL